MIYYVFDCANCDVEPAYLIDVTEFVLCGNCRNSGKAKQLTDKEVAELDLPISE
jgi:hypothetical protein